MRKAERDAGMQRPDTRRTRREIKKKSSIDVLHCFDGNCGGLSVIERVSGLKWTSGNRICVKESRSNAGAPMKV
jgi:hypothetical protein